MSSFDEITINDEAMALIPEGIYEVIYTDHTKYKYYSQDKLQINFVVVSPTEYSDTVLTRIYNYYDRAKRNSDYIKECQIVLGRRLNKKEKVSPSIFKNKVLKVKVRTVKNGRKQEKLPSFLQYSIIDSIVDVVTGVKTND